ncbi:hypothetical protein LCGC14_2633680 [marine sediment metagenome]|uniref:Uncharacterized protein n=1 Tax=marine sediment metagenome TaxID=412755 RepID=A0A0F9AM37_9ZZZZ
MMGMVPDGLVERKGIMSQIALEKRMNEIRRLEDVNTALLEALEIIQLEASEADESDNPYNVLESIDKLARAAIEAAK